METTVFIYLFIKKKKQYYSKVFKNQFKTQKIHLKMKIKFWK